MWSRVLDWISKGFRRVVLLLVLCLGACFSPLSAEHVLQSRHLTTADGLAANTVRHIFQDEEGYLWFSTNNGLSRYDGYSIRNYRQEAGIGDLRIKEVKEDAEHHILISTIQGGYYCLDKETGRTIFSPRNKEAEADSITRDIRPTRNDHLLSEIKDERGNLWRLGRDGSLQFILVKEGKNFVLPNVINDKISYGNSFIFRICYTHRGLVAIATTGNGLFIFDPQDGHLEHYVCDEQNSASPLASNNIISIMEDRKGSLWIGYELMGVTQLHISDDTGFRFVYPSGQNHSLGTDAEVVRAVLYDHFKDCLLIADKQSGVIWFDSTLTSRRTMQLADNAYCFAQDPEGGLWMGTRGSGIWYEGKYFRHNDEDEASLSNDDVYSLLFDRKGTLWAGTLGGGLCRAFDWKDGKVRFDRFFQNSYGERRIRSLAQDSNGLIWAGTSHGVMIFNPERMNGGEKEVFRLTVESGHLKSNEVRSVFITRSGQAFISELGNGFAVTQVPASTEGYKDMRFMHFDSGEGLCNDMVQSFGEDRFGKVWIATELGLSRFNSENKQFEESFFPSPIMSGNVFSEGCSTTLPDGRIVFSGSRGAVVIDPNYFQSMQGEKPKVHVVSQEVDGHSMSVNYTTFDFAIRPSAIRYSYRLGNEDWSPLSPAGRIDLKSLPSGHYSLLLRAVNESGHWSDPIDLSFDIAWPWYLRGWAICLWTLLLAGAAWFAFSQIRDRMQLRQHIRLQEQLNEAKLVFFTNVSHEFRTPLTLMRGALERIRKAGRLPEALEQPVTLMEHNSDRLMHLINQLLEFRRMENNVMSLRLEKMDIIGLLRELFDSFHDVAEQKHLDYRMTTPQQALWGYFDRSCIDKVIYNLLSNAIKYTPEGGKILLEVRANPAPVNELSIRVVDNGVGVPEDQRSHLFERFNRSHYLSGSMGIGLNLCAALVEVHHGEIGYKPNPGGGSIFTVTLPLGEESYTKEDYLVSGELLHEPEPATAEAELPSLLAPINSQRVLLIEDNDDLRLYVKTELQQYFNVDVAKDGQEGLAKVESADEGYDLVITDIMMPGISGLEVIQYLRQHFNTSHIPIVALTALDSTTSRIEGLQAGVDAYITKPFSTQLLLATIINLMNQRSLLKEKFSADKSLQQTMITTSELDREFLERLDAVIDKHLSDAAFSADDFAGEMALGRTIFFRKVKGVTGFSPKEYLRIRRMKKAAALLAEGRLSVSAIAYEVGLKDPFYFSRCFKQQFGVTPSEYVRKVREESSVEITENTDSE